MFKNMKLGMKITCGFAALIVIAVALGGLAVWNMNNVKTVANELSNAKAPEVAVANNVERTSLLTMYTVRGYIYTEDKTFLEAGQKDLADVMKFLGEAKAHAEKYNIDVLRQNTAKAESKAREYEQLLNETVAKTDDMAKQKAASLLAADKYMKVCSDYIAAQKKMQDEEVKASAELLGSGTSSTQPASTAVDIERTLSDRAKKIEIANDIVDLGNCIRIGTWQSIATRDPKLFQETEKKFEQVVAKLDELKADTKQEVNLKRIEECRAAGKEYLGCMEQFLASWTAREELNKKRGEVANAVLAAAKDTAQAGMDEVTKSSSAAASSLSTASTTMIVGLSVGVIMGILMSIFITRSITGPINRIISGLTGGAEQTASAAGQVSAASQSLAQGASEQAAAIEETTASVEEMSSMTKQNAANAEEAKSVAANAKSSADKGFQAMGRMSTAIEDIKKSSDQTAKIIKTIDEIAFQTNLLALNAAVEAARAGEAGKGFAVVAEEVRNLAQRSAEAARNTADMIEQSVKNADNGVQITNEVAKALEEIAGGAKQVNELVAQIASASNDQAQGIEQISSSVSQMDTVTQQNAANAEESASASEELNAQAEELNHMVAELRNMVGGSQNASFAPTKARSAKFQHAPGKSAAAKAAPARQGKAGHFNAPAKTHAQEVIPLTADDELAKF